MGLRGISSSSIMSGVTTAISIKTGIDTSETGLASIIVNSLLPLVNSQAHFYFLLVSISLGILSILLIIVFIIQIISNGIPGIATASLGILGPIIILLSPVTNIPLILIGVLLTGSSIYLAEKY